MSKRQARRLIRAYWLNDNRPLREMAKRLGMCQSATLFWARAALGKI